MYRPTPSLAEIEESTIQFCGLDWTYLQSKFDVHPYTANEQLSHRCVEGLYLLALLKDGFGFKSDSRDISIALDVRYTAAVYEYSRLHLFYIYRLLLCCSVLLCDPFMDRWKVMKLIIV